MDLNDNMSSLLDQERQTRRDEVAIDLEDRGTKKGTPPIPSEAGDIRDLRRDGGLGEGGVARVTAGSATFETSTHKEQGHNVNVQEIGRH